jgi:hypothetical protein
VVNPATAVVTAVESVRKPANLRKWLSVGLSLSGWRDLTRDPLTPKSADTLCPVILSCDSRTAAAGETRYVIAH